MSRGYMTMTSRCFLLLRPRPEVAALIHANEPFLRPLAYENSTPSTTKKTQRQCHRVCVFHYSSIKPVSCRYSETDVFFFRGGGVLPSFYGCRASIVSTSIMALVCIFELRKFRMGNSKNAYDMTWQQRKPVCYRVCYRRAAAAYFCLFISRRSVFLFSFMRDFHFPTRQPDQSL